MKGFRMFRYDNGPLKLFSALGRDSGGRTSRAREWFKP